MVEKSAKIYVAGHNGMVGSAIVRRLNRDGYENIVVRSHRELDLTRQADVEAFFERERPDYVYLAAAKVGGIEANMKHQADFMMTNLQIQCNVLSAAFQNQVKKLLLLGSSCIYPCKARQPITEDALLTGPLEPTNEGYAIAKIAGMKQCEHYKKQYGANFISVMPCNLYGYRDNYDVTRCHLIPALIRKFHSAKVHGRDHVTIWGTGTSMREFLFADDMADGCVMVMERYDGEQFLNIGYGRDLPILRIAELVKETVGFQGEIRTDPSKPEGMYRKVLDSSRINALGWRPRTDLREGLKLAYRWFLENIEDRDELYT